MQQNAAPTHPARGAGQRLQQHWGTEQPAPTQCETRAVYALLCCPEVWVRAQNGKITQWQFQTLWSCHQPHQHFEDLCSTEIMAQVLMRCESRRGGAAWPRLRALQNWQLQQLRAEHACFCPGTRRFLLRRLPTLKGSSEKTGMVGEEKSLLLK